MAVHQRDYDLCRLARALAATLKDVASVARVLDIEATRARLCGVCSSQHALGCYAD